jgi:hypothetical protein
MKVSPVDTSDLELLAPSEGRSEGLHMSDIYTALYQRLEPKRYGKPGAPRDMGGTLRMAVGVAWERYLEEVLIASGVDAQRPSEQMTSDGVAYSPDLLIDGGERVGEIKATWLSSRTDPHHPKFAKWLTQAAAYCRAQGTTRCRFYVLHLNGNYADDRNPALNIWDIEFTQEELEANWASLHEFATKESML